MNANTEITIVITIDREREEVRVTSHVTGAKIGNETSIMRSAAVQALYCIDPGGDTQIQEDFDGDEMVLYWEAMPIIAESSAVSDEEDLLGMATLAKLQNYSLEFDDGEE